MPEPPPALLGADVTGMVPTPRASAEGAPCAPVSTDAAECEKTKVCSEVQKEVFAHTAAVAHSTPITRPPRSTPRMKEPSPHSLEPAAMATGARARGAFTPRALLIII